MSARRGGERDLTKGPIMGTLIAFTAPSLLASVLQTLNGTINSIFVGQMLGEDALAATANANVIMFLLFAAVFGFGMAATVSVGRAIGAGNPDAARRSMGTAIGLCSLIALVVAPGGWLLAPKLLEVMGTPGSAAPLALAYLRVVFLAMPAAMIVTMLSMGLRGAGDATTPLLFMVVMVGLDVALNPLLIAGIGPFPQLGIAGSALATAIANYAAMIGMVIWIYRRDLVLRLRGKELAYLIPAREELRFLIAKGLPMGIQMLVVSGSGLIMVSLVNREGLATAAAYAASLQLWSYLQMPAMAVGGAVSAMAAQAIGARLADRIGAVTRAGIIANLGLTAPLIAILLAFDRPILALFLGSDSPSIPIARHMQLIGSWAFLLLGIMFVLFGTLRAFGVVIAPLLVLIGAMYGIRLTFYFAAYPHLGTDTLWWTFPVSAAASATLAWIAYARIVPRELAKLRAGAEAA